MGIRPVHWLVLSLLIAVIAGPVARAADVPPPVPPAAVPAPPQPPRGNPDVNPITKAFVQEGVLACSGRINQVSNFLTGGATPVGAHLFPLKGAPDQSLVTASLELNFAESQQTSYAGMSFAPNGAGGCTAAYEAVSYWPASCDNVASKQFGTMKRAGAIRKNIAVLDGGAARVFLMPAGSGCVSIKKEVVQ